MTEEQFLREFRRGLTMIISAIDQRQESLRTEAVTAKIARHAERELAAR